MNKIGLAIGFVIVWLLALTLYVVFESLERSINMRDQLPEKNELTGSLDVSSVNDRGESVGPESLHSAEEWRHRWDQMKEEMEEKINAESGSGSAERQEYLQSIRDESEDLIQKLQLQIEQVEGKTN